MAIFLDNHNEWLEADGLGVGEQVKPFPVQLPGVPYPVRVDPVEQAKGDCRPAVPGGAHGRSWPTPLKAESHSSWIGG